MPDRTVAPPLQHTLRFELPKPECFLNKAGVNGWLVPSDLQAVVRIEIVFPSGKIAEQKESVSSFTASMLEKGTKNHNAQQLAAKLDYYSAHIEINPGMDLTTIGLYCLTRNVGKILPLFLEILSEPSFDENELRLYKEIFLQNLEVNKEKNAYLANQAIRGLVFANHPYGTTVNAEDVQQITREDLNEFFEKFYNPTEIFVAGSIGKNDLKTLADGFNNSKTTGFTFAEPEIVKGEKRIEKKESVQCSIRMGKVGIARTSADFPVFLLTNHILGGYFGSRLMKNIREEKGLTYGISSGNQHFLKSTLQSIGADVNKENLDQAIEAIKLELNELGQISDEELTIAKNHFIGTLQNDVTTIFAATDKIKTIRLNDLQPDYYQDLINKIDRLTTAEIKMAAEKYFKAEDFSVAIAG